MNGGKASGSKWRPWLRFEGGKELTSHCCGEWNIFQNLNKTSVAE